jgi:hypothetical protein
MKLSVVVGVGVYPSSLPHPKSATLYPLVWLYELLGISIISWGEPTVLLGVKPCI